MDTQLLKGRVQDYLTSYLLKNVWNRPYTEFRQNIKLRLLSNKKTVSVVEVGNKRVYLPSNHSYYVYECPTQRSIGLYAKSDTWCSLREFINTSGLDIRLHGIYGGLIYREDIHVKTVQGVMVFAVLADTYKLILKNNPLDQVYMHLFYHKDIAKTHVTCRTLASPRELDKLYEQSLDSDIVFINGKESDVVSKNCFKIDDKVELITDPGIVGVCSIDSTKSVEYKTFLDSSDNKEKLIVHIPKALNPTNTLLTHNTCDIYIRPKPPSDTSNPEYYKTRTQGIYLSRANTDTHIGQITHNDFYISEELIEQYKSEYNLEDIIIHVVVRTANKYDKLVDEANHIKVLYTLPDAEILRFLSGGGDTTLIDHWDADTLANSPYAKTLYQLQKPELHDDLSMYVDMFGYLTCANIVCSKVQRYRIKPYSGHTVGIPIPMTLFNANDVTCLVFINGLMVSRDRYTTTRHGNELVIQLDEDIELKVGQTLIFELFDYVEPRAEYITPSSQQSTLDVEGPVSIYRVRDIGGGEVVTPNLLNSSYVMTESFEETTTGITRSGDTLTFSTPTHGNTYLVTSKRSFGKTHGLEFSIDSLDYDIISTGLLKIDCKTWTDEEDITIPCLWENLLPFMNGRSLAKDIDYTQVPIKTTTDNLVGYVVHVNNIDALEEENNVLELLLSPDEELIRLNDFSHKHFTDSIFTTLMWSQNINMMTAAGYAADIVSKSVDRLSMAHDIPAGSLLNTRISLPQELIDILDDASSNTGITSYTDMLRARRLVEFLKARQDQNYKLSVIEKSHNLYSILTTKYIKETLAGNSPVLEDYLALSEQDVVLNSHLRTVTVQGTKKLDGRANGIYTVQNSNKDSTLCIWENSNGFTIAYVPPFWGIYSDDMDLIYTSLPVYRVCSPWLLIWPTDQNGDGPQLISDAIDLRYIDAFPSYRAYDISATGPYASTYNTLRDTINDIFPVDGIQAGVTMR